jgi:hypothetical protein
MLRTAASSITLAARPLCATLVMIVMTLSMRPLYRAVKENLALVDPGYCAGTHTLSSWGRLRYRGWATVPDPAGGSELADPDSLPNNPAIHVVDLLLPQARVTVSAVVGCRDSRAEGSSA